MKRVELEIDDKFARLLSLTFIGINGTDTDVTTYIVDLSNGTNIKIGNDGKGVQLN